MNIVRADPLKHTDIIIILYELKYEKIKKNAEIYLITLVVSLYQQSVGKGSKQFLKEKLLIHLPLENWLLVFHKLLKF